MFDCFFYLSALFFGADMRFLCGETSDFETVIFGNVRGFSLFCVICGTLRIGRMSCPKLRLRRKRGLFEREKVSFFDWECAQIRVNLSEMLSLYKK